MQYLIMIIIGFIMIAIGIVGYLSNNTVVKTEEKTRTLVKDTNGAVIEVYYSPDVFDKGYKLVPKEKIKK